MDFLPSSYQRVFAFTGILRGKSIFDQSDLEAIGVKDEASSLGLLQSREVLTPLGRSYQCHFLHQSVMEFAAAFHIVTLPSNSQLLASNLLLETNPTSLVLPLFAGMCGVESHDVLAMVRKVAKEHSMYKQVSVGRLDWPKNKHEMEELLSKDYGSLWTLFNCICEAQYAPKGISTKIGWCSILASFDWIQWIVLHLVAVSRKPYRRSIQAQI